MNTSDLPAFFEHRDKIILKLSQINSDQIDLASNESPDGKIIKP
jgi:hypothetical protein